jgi:hypothetical protein
MKSRAAEAWELSALVELVSLVALHPQACWWWFLPRSKNRVTVWTCPLFSITSFSPCTQDHWRAHILICCLGKGWGFREEEPWTKTGPPPLLPHCTPLITNQGSSSQGSSSKLLLLVEIFSELWVTAANPQS